MQKHPNDCDVDDDKGREKWREAEAYRQANNG